jgi:AbiV family abortive infection protein
MKNHNQYCGPLTPAEIAAGMNAARENAARLSNDARLLFENERYASSLALAILAVEESGKESVLRGLAAAASDAEVQKAWRSYRSHTSKNAHWAMFNYFFKGARKLGDFLPVFESGAEHTHTLDRAKQLSIYTDMSKKGFWAKPTKIVTKGMAEGILNIAEMLSKGREVSCEEMELWAEYLKPVWRISNGARQTALIGWDKEMRKRGLTPADTITMEEFVTVGIQLPQKRAN